MEREFSVVEFDLIISFIFSLIRFLSMILSLPFITQLFPNKIIYHRLNDLLLHRCQIDDENEWICLSIEINEHCRKFCYISIDELFHLFQRSSHLERSLYEVIKSTKKIKPYIDFEYTREINPDLYDPLVGLRCALKILYHLFHRDCIHWRSQQEFAEIILREYLILDAYMRLFFLLYYKLLSIFQINITESIISHH